MHSIQSFPKAAVPQRIPLNNNSLKNNTLSQSLPQVSFGASGDFGERLSAKAKEMGPGKLFKYGLIALGALTGSTTLLSNYSYEENPGSTRSVVYSRYSSDGFWKDSDGSIAVKKSGYVSTYGQFFAENLPFDVRPQQVRDTFQPFSREGVKIDGNNQGADQGIDIQIIFSIDGGPDKIKDETTGKERDVKEEERDPYYKISLPLLASKIIGTYEFNKDNPSYQRQAAYFATPEINTRLGDMMKMVYYTKVVPVLQESLNIAATKFNASDIHENRQRLEDMILNGYKTKMKNAEGKEIEVVLIKPLEQKLLENGIRLKNFELTKFDTPDFLSTLNQQRTNISIEKNTLDLETQKFTAQKDQVRSKVQAEFASKLEKQRGVNQSELATKLGEVEQAKETAKTKEQEGLGYQNEQVAKANGDAEKLVLEAEKEAATILKNANIKKAESEAEAAKIFNGIVAPAKLEAEAKRKLGEMLRKHPEYLEQLRIAAAAKNQEAIAKLIEGMLLSPDSSPVDVLRSVSGSSVQTKPLPPQQPVAPTAGDK
jgi:hypothetical protein